MKTFSWHWRSVERLQNINYSEKPNCQLLGHLINSKRYYKLIDRKRKCLPLPKSSIRKINNYKVFIPLINVKIYHVEWSKPVSKNKKVSI